MIHESKNIVFFDTEVEPDSGKIIDMGAVYLDFAKLHSSVPGEMICFLKGNEFICGHNILKHDAKYAAEIIESAGITRIIDTLYLSPLLFPQKPYHALLKDDKLQQDELNNPLNDAMKAMELFFDEADSFNKLSERRKKIYYTLLGTTREFCDFFIYLNYSCQEPNVVALIKDEFKGMICENVDLEGIIKKYPIELAYCLASISVADKESILPFWVRKNFLQIEQLFKILRGTPCKEECSYCKYAFDIHFHLKQKYNYDNFRSYNGEPLQEKAVLAAVHNKSLLAIFPTGGGKSITFQLPALMAGETEKGLTVVISPLQSLMKDQVDNLSRMGIADAVTINGLLNAVERSEALERVEKGIASMLYISPESLRSKTIERLLWGRNVVRFVIDEAHCFSSWGQDFRVDYLYIGDFIRRLQEKKNTRIPVSCFTATAKQKVISDIREYFKQKLELDLELFTTSAARTNLRYEVLLRETDNEKYSTLRSLIEQKNCPTIVYVSRTKRTVELAERLCGDGFNAKAFHGKLDSKEKIKNQEAFICGEVQIIVATSAFGMGVDKKDVKLVIHYDISDSLENYVQEAGRAGRDQNIQAECYVLFNESDLDKHFILLNQTKLSINEIQQIWKGIKDLTKVRKRICCSPLELARQAGWEDSNIDIETKVKTAISALETAGYIRRGQNCPRVYADSIQYKHAREIVELIDESNNFNERQKEHAKRIIKKLISSRSRANAGNEEAESRVDYIADHLGITKAEVIETIEIMREEGILANEKELTAYVKIGEGRNRSKNILKKFTELEAYLITLLNDEKTRFQYKEINELAIEQGIKASAVNNIRLILYFWIIKGYIKKPIGETANGMNIEVQTDYDTFQNRFEKRGRLAEFIDEYLSDRAKEVFYDGNTEECTVSFSVLEIKRAFENEILLFDNKASLEEVEEALLYLEKINAIQLEGGFLVTYNGMEIVRLELDNKKRYKLEDYRQLSEFYNSKTQQIHIVGEYANMMVRNYEEALTYVNDYFQMDYRLFLSKYFKGKRMDEINRNITPIKYEKLFEGLSDQQAEIISDDKSQYIVVAAGPGSGKTKILVHKLASLMLLEDVKHEQLLMLTFSRAAMMEFKSRLVNLIGNAAYFVEIKTFHSYCLDLLGKIGKSENLKNVVQEATERIKNQEVELGRITKTVVVIDEAQDMDSNEYELIKELMERNDEMRVIAVGDDDQNIYGFRGSDSKYMAELLSEQKSKKYELIDNYRSDKLIVNFSNEFLCLLKNRLKLEVCRPVSVNDGEVWLVKNNSYLEQSVVHVMQNTWNTDMDKTVGVLTSTNEEAYLIARLLSKQGYCVRLIRSNEGFALWDLAEIRFFVNQIQNHEDLPVISDELWEKSIIELQKVYGTSENLPMCINLLQQFEKTTLKKYYTDFEAYIRESKFEDFIRGGRNEICVSTIHKSKGREYDFVYMMLNNTCIDTEEQKRSIYVGITRAKSKLFICYKHDFLSAIKENTKRAGVCWYFDNKEYQKADEIVIPLTHEDVHLDFFKDEKRNEVISSLRSGDELQIIEQKYETSSAFYFVYHSFGRDIKVAKGSKKFYGKVCEQRKHGYEPYLARVQYVAIWRDKEEKKEHNILLPIVCFRRRNT